MSIKEQFTTNLNRVSSAVTQAFDVATSVIDTVQDPVGALSNLGSKYSTQNLRFPRDVENPDVGIGNHGHYMMFYIRTREKPKLSFAEKRAIANEGKLSVKKAQKQQGNVPKGNIPSIQNWLILN